MVVNSQPMASDLLQLALLAAFTATAVLYWLLLRERAQERRLRARIDDTIHLAAVVRAQLAERRQTA